MKLKDDKRRLIIKGKKGKDYQIYLAKANSNWLKKILDFSQIG